MSIDPYAPCPCGSGKKLKFCCSDLAHEIEKVQKMVAGEQPHAALEHLRGLLAKQPERASLLDLCANLELAIEDFDAAQTTIDKFLAAHPKNPAAHAQKATLVAATQSGGDAVLYLQDALELLDDDMPLRVFEAIGSVGHALLLDGSLVAGRGHLVLYAGIAPEGDNLALQLLLRMNLQAGLPLLMREYLILKSCPEDVPWSGEFEQAHRAAGRGQWRVAEEIFASLREKAGPDPAIVYNLAVVRGWLNNDQAFADGLHEYARLDVPELQAVEAEALAQLVDPSLEDPQLQTVRITYSVSDEDALTEMLASDKRVEFYPLDPAGFAEDAPQPRSSYILLTKPTPPASPDLTPDEIPRVLGFLSLYGKRTDRDAQLELTTDRNESFGLVQSLLTEIAGGQLGDQLAEEVVSEKSLSEESLSWRWRLPPGTPQEQRNKLVASERKAAIQEQWANAPRAALEMKSPTEAAGDPNLRIPLLASVLIIEQAAVDPDDLSWFGDLRARLGLPPQEKIDPTQVKVEEMAMVHMPHLDLAKLNNEQLIQLLDRAAMQGANLATLLLGGELVSRGEQAADVDMTGVFRQLVRTDPDLTRASRWVEKARQWAQSKNKPQGQWALLELELAIQRGDSARAQQILDEIRTVHIREPGIAEATYRLLYAIGAIDPANQVKKPTQLEMLDAVHEGSSGEPSGRLWTPGQSTTAESPNSGKTAIWTP